MILPEGTHEVPAGHLAAATTYLEMFAPAMDAAKAFPDGISAARERLDNDSYRALFRKIGAPWLWTSRLTIGDDALSEILDDERTETWVIRDGAEAIGLVELDFQASDECELAFFGMVPSATGKGLGGPMMALAQDQAFSRGIKRFFVHTCHFDSPAAVAFYRKAGFVPYKYAVEVFPDPRIDGPHNSDTAPQIPIIK